MTEKKPIRKDRVLLALLFVVTIILVPILLTSGGSDTVTPAASTGDQTVGVMTGTPAMPPVEETTPSEQSPPSEENTTGTEATQPTATTLVTHVVQAGETLASIAAQLNVTAMEIMADNQLVTADAIEPGMTLKVSSEGVLHLIKSGQTLTDISTTYGVSVTQITQANAINDPARIFAGETIIIPGATTDLWAEVVKLSHGQKTRFIWPAEGDITSPFGWRDNPVLGIHEHHNGIDIDVPLGTTVRAAAAGKVYFAGDNEGYGTTVILRHADDYYSVYGHLSTILVKTGQFVEMGQPIAESGNTGTSTGPHLHFEVRNGEFPVDPMRYLPN